MKRLLLLSLGIAILSTPVMAAEPVAANQQPDDIRHGQKVTLAEFEGSMLAGSNGRPAVICNELLRKIERRNAVQRAADEAAGLRGV